MNFKKTNNITGWLVFLIAFATYFLTIEARGSLWDCGEFVSSADKVQLPHPPGAPMFVLLGRFFIILFGDNKLSAAHAVNFMSALASAATILFLFWSVTHFARKMFVTVGEQLTSGQIFTTMSAGVVGALAYTFSDSFWFSAVEGEVYALSSFFTALVFWAMLKWEHADERAGIDPAARSRSDRWIVFLFFMMGLSIGVHLLNLLSIPAIVMIYFFRRNYDHEGSKSDYQRLKKDSMLLWTIGLSFALTLLLIVMGAKNRESDPTKFAYVVAFAGGIVALVRVYMKYPELRKVVTAFIIGCVTTVITQLGVIQYSMKGAGEFDVFFVNSLGMPFFSGFAIYFLALAALIVWALRFNENTVARSRVITFFILFLVLSALPFIVGTGSGGVKFVKFLLIGGIGLLIGYFIKASALRVVKLGLWCYAFMMLGYFMYFTALIRSNANPAIDMNNVDNPINLVYYLSREQYGEQPIFYGPHFAAEYDYGEDGYPKLKEGEMKYVKSKGKYIPIGRDKKPIYKSEDMQIFPRVWDASNDQFHAEFYKDWLGLRDPQTGKAIAPTYGDNVNWFFSYQMGLMYWRYFMWNFAGKQNDLQGLGNKRDGNWITGIPLVDNARLGDQSKLPDSIKHNAAHNQLYLLPFILGIVGCVYQFFRNRKDWIVTFLLFFLTGIAVVIYLNQPGNQPRERDYAYVGSFYAFAIWIGLAVVAFVKIARDVSKQQKEFKYTIIGGGILTFLITLMSCANDIMGGMVMACLFITALFAAATAAIVYLLRAVSRNGQNESILNIVAGVICVIAPLIMAQQEWNDHNRSHKTTAPDIARDYLESCAPNAVLFTFGDNDTYPLWYAQEVEGVRPDIRVINNSLLGIDWYINQLRYKVNEADSIDVIWTPEQIEGHNREYLRYRAQGDPNEYYDLYDVMKNVLGKPNIDPETGRDIGYGSFPVAKFRVPVDTAFVRSNGTVGPNDSVLSEMRFEIPKGKLDDALLRSDLIILNFIASNHWKRPIYFTSPFGELGFAPYLRKDGLSYRLVPVLSKNPQENWVVEKASRLARLGGTQIRDNNGDVMYNNMMTKFGFGAEPGKNVYFDEENRRHILSIREIYGEAAGNLADQGKKEEAQKLLDKCEAGIDPKNLPYAMASRFGSHNQNSLIYLEACYKAGKTDLAEKYRQAIRKDLEQQRAYFLFMNGGEVPDVSDLGSDTNKPLFQGFVTEYQINEAQLAVLAEIEKAYAPGTAKPTEGLNPPIINNIKQDTSKPKDSPPKQP